MEVITAAHSERTHCTLGKASAPVGHRAPRSAHRRPAARPTATGRSLPIIAAPVPTLTVVKKFGRHFLLFSKILI
ncbi:unnamed protein product [Colias eurytheme]|nr:unnamed protein product [Colias eurytheme]